MSDQTIIKSQWPQAGSSVHHRSLIYLYPAAEIEADLVVVPDLTGKTVHESLLSANEAGLNILIEGDCLGIVKSQTPGSTHGETTDHESETDNEANDNVVDNGSENTPGNDETDGLGEEIDPETGNPIKNPTNRLQRGSQIILRFEQIEEHLDEISTGDEHDASETQSSDAAE
jgi:beta-lactam-binding protein with PASTA domain